ncbi:Hypothetical protein Minf_1934 [Methylacidiphilum infernorum V4]|uniref:Uncharacterized protein n=1 Tax=Methylacidiphilum infernorum (isolate V4) TaxID=481448 RepID=B3DYE0_METI4|nr:Hypothetical protein Minf_1934 [Methylacidiphilum infernorum V4]
MIDPSLFIGYEYNRKYEFKKLIGIRQEKDRKF